MARLCDYCDQPATHRATWFDEHSSPYTHTEYVCHDHAETMPTFAGAAYLPTITGDTTWKAITPDPQPRRMLATLPGGLEYYPLPELIGRAGAYYVQTGQAKEGPFPTIEAAQRWTEADRLTSWQLETGDGPAPECAGCLNLHNPSTDAAIACTQCTEGSEYVDPAEGYPSGTVDDLERYPDEPRSFERLAFALALTRNAARADLAAAMVA
jgi:hypothetical protein